MTDVLKGSRLCHVKKQTSKREKQHDDGGRNSSAVDCQRKASEVQKRQGRILP